MAAIVLGAGGAQAAGGALDPTFGSGGIVRTDLGGEFDSARAIAIQPDGKIVVAGNSDAEDRGDLALVRYTSDGQLDASFGSGGKILTDLGGHSLDRGNAVVVQRSGKIVVVGQRVAEGAVDLALVRYTRLGALDASFGTGGRALTNLRPRSADEANAIAVQADGKLVVAGASKVEGRGVLDLALVRYTSDGKLDRIFGSGGKVLTDRGLDRANAVAVARDGKIVVAGTGGKGITDFALVRYTTSGRLDTGFGNGGKVLTDLGGGFDYARALVIQAGGKIVVAGSSQTKPGSLEHFALVRYMPNGKLDRSFGSGGKVVTDLGGTDDASAVVLQADGKIIVAGTSDIAKHPAFALVRYTAVGKLDRSFGSDGKVVTALGDDKVNSYAAAAAIQKNGKVIVAGNSGSVYAKGGYDFAVVRYTQ